MKKILNTILLISCFILCGSANAVEEKKTFIIEFHQQPLSLLYGAALRNTNVDTKISDSKTIHQSFIKRLSQQFNKSASVYPIMNEYHYALNGIAISLTQQEAAWIQNQVEIKSTRLERQYQVNTDIGPEWIGASQVWNGLSVDLPPNRGEGVVIGVIDTGINAQHPAFQEVSQPGTADEYTHTNPKGRTFGLCNAQNCNNKLIGIYDFTNEGTSGIDSTGHGSHVAGIALGNVYTTNHLGFDFTVSGVAPRANLISYKACVFAEGTSGTCSGNDLLAAIDQSVADGVDVVNYSIGSEFPCSPWGNIDNNGDWCGRFQIGLASAAMLNARQAGVLYSVSAGNSGPGPATVGFPAIAPWVLAVANATHSRLLQSEVVNFTGGESDLADLVGASATEGVGPLRIVHASDFGNALCGQGQSELRSLCSGNGDDVLTGASNPFANNTFNGEIVVCDRGTYGRIEKGFNVKQAGAAGYILANTNAQQESIVADAHCLPATHLGNQSGTLLRDWLATGDDHMGSITGQTLVYDEALGDVLASSSSRGPSEIVYNTFSSANATRRSVNYMKPNIAAPGTSIFSAAQTGDGLATLTGTSMAAPHVAGSAALIKSAHPNYNPAQIESSLILTADASQMLKEDQVTPADFADQGAGRVRVDRAVANSLYFDISRQEFINANPQDGGDVRQLNSPSIVDNNCYPSCTFSRTVKLLDSYNVVNPIWRVTSEQDNGLDITVTPNSFDFSESNEVTLSINVNTTANDVIGDWAEAVIAFTVESSSNSEPLPNLITPSVSRLPLAVFVPAGDYPTVISQQVTSRHGSFDINLNDITPMTDATYVGLGVLTPSHEQYDLSVDNNNTPFNDDGVFDSLGTGFRLFEVTEFKPLAIIESDTDTDFGADLYVGKDLNINSTPDEREILCQEISLEHNKFCVLRNLTPGLYWVMVHNNPVNGFSQVSTNLAVFNDQDTAIKTQFIGGDIEKGAGIYVRGPVDVQTSAQLNVQYELPTQLSETRDYYAAIAVGADTDSVGKTAVIPIKFSAFESASEKVYALNNSVADFRYQLGDLLSNMYVDTGLGAGQITLSAPQIPYTAHFYRADFDFDPLDYMPDLSNLNADFVIQSTTIVSQDSNDFDNIEQVMLDVSGFTPSRWFIEIEPLAFVESGPLSAYFAIQSVVDYDLNQLVLPNQSLWFNPQRSGWGIDLSQTNSSQAVTWYTYSDDLRPLWMQAIGELSAQNQWQGSMNYVTWNGESPKVQAFGDMSMVYLSENSAIISISTPEATYTERLSSLYSPENNCPELNDKQALDVTGLWFLPQQSGFGSTVLSTESTESSVLYFYDDTGVPVWAIGTRTLNDQETQLTQVLNGFCPTCQATTINAEVVGRIINTYDTENSGNMQAEVELLSPLSGEWQSDGVSQKLNRNFGCIISQ